MTAFQIYAAFGAPLILFILCGAMVFATRPKNARRRRSSDARRQTSPVESEIADIKARITRMEIQVDRLRAAAGDHGDDGVLQPAAQ